MKKSLFALIIASTLLISQAFAVSFEEELQIKADIMDVSSAIADAYLTNNTDFLDSIYSPKMIYINPFGKELTKDQILEDLRSNTLTFKDYELDSIFIRIFKDIVVSSGTATANALRSGSTMAGKFRFMRIFQLTENGWQVIGFSCMRLKSN